MLPALGRAWVIHAAQLPAQGDKWREQFVGGANQGHMTAAATAAAGAATATAEAGSAGAA